MQHERRNMSLRWIFPTPILQADLNPNESQARAMQRQLEIFDRLAYQSNSNKNQKMLTGDKLGEIRLDQLHHSSSFRMAESTTGTPSDNLDERTLLATRLHLMFTFKKDGHDLRCQRRSDQPAQPSKC